MKKQKNSKQEKSAPANNAPALPPVAKSFDELAAMCQRMIPVPIMVGEQVMQVEVRCLNARESAVLQTVLAGVRPPPLPPEEGEERRGPRYDFQDAKYLQESADCRRRVRSVGVYWACPIIQSKKPGLEKWEAIHEFVSEQLPDGVLQDLWAVIFTDGKLEEAINFISPLA